MKAGEDSEKASTMRQRLVSWRVFEWLISLFFLAVGVLGVFFAPSLQAWYVAYCRERPWYMGLMPQFFRDYVFSPDIIWSYRLCGGVSLMLGALSVVVLLSSKRQALMKRTDGTLPAKSSPDAPK